MNTLLSVYKPAGYTPLQTIEKLRELYPQYKDERIGYAGRLDPLAHGVLLLMVGEAAKQREKYLNLPKEYHFTALLGVETDSYDLLGYVAKTQFPFDSHNNVNNIVMSFVNKNKGKLLQSYPPFSSKAVQGKPLFWWAKQNRLHEIIMPQREVEITDFTLESTGTIRGLDLQKKLHTEIGTIKGEFRQAETLKRWDEFLKDKINYAFPTFSFFISCTSGTYVRQLVHSLGKTLGCGAIALEIHRTRVGEYTEEKSLRLF